MSKTSRNVTIDFLRFLFSVIVVLHHSRYVLGDDHCYFLGGSLAVEFFFFVSGYLLLVSTGKAGKSSAANAGQDKIGTETFHFLTHKLRGFLPEFLTAWWIGFFFVGLVRKMSLHQLLGALEDDFWELTLVKMSGLFTHGIDGAMWYLSAMILSMAVLYPLLRKKKDLMTHLVCPLLALFLYGYLCRAQGHPRDPVVWLGVVYKGLIRAIAGLCTGVVIRMAVQKMQREAPKGLTRPGNALAAAVQLLCLVLTIRYMALQKPTRYDYFYMFLLLVLILLSFSGFGLEKVLGKNRFLQRLSGFLGKYSLSLYLGHLYFAQHVGEILPASEYSGRVRMAVYLALALLNGFVVMGLAGIWREKKPEEKVKRLLVKESG